MNETGPEGRYKRGYNTNHLPADVQAKLKELEKTRPFLNIMEAVVTLLSIPALATLYVLAVLRLAETGIPAPIQGVIVLFGYAATICLIARQQRGLELMVHDASHKAWNRAKPTHNNWWANLLVAYPVLSTVQAYWKSHVVHHGRYGSHLDPCRQRFQNMGLVGLDLSTSWKIMRAVLRWLPQYNREYYQEIGSLSLSMWGRWAAWHTCVFLLPQAITFLVLADYSLGVALLVSVFLWVIFWMIPATSALTVLRSIAEAEEHDYERGNTEFETTFTNDGPWHWYFHPKNDRYHLVHHMFPAIPERVHHKVHKLLMEHDPKYKNALHRTNILQR